MTSTLRSVLAIAFILVPSSICRAQAGRPEKMAFGGHLGCVNVVAYSRDGKTLFSASEDTSVKLWDAETLKLKETLRTKTGPVTALAVSPVGNTLAMAVVRYDKKVD